jgi:hypothetical protein
MFFPDPGSDFFPSLIPDPNFFHPGSDLHQRIKVFNPRKRFLSSRKSDPGYSYRISDPDPDFLPIPDPGVNKAPDPGSGSATLIGMGGGGGRIGAPLTPDSGSGHTPHRGTQAKGGEVWTQNVRRPLLKYVMRQGGHQCNCLSQCCCEAVFIESGSWLFGIVNPDQIRDPDLKIRMGNRIDFGIGWIRISIGNADPYSGEQKIHNKIRKVKICHVLKYWMFSFEGWRRLLQLKNFTIFLSLNPGSVVKPMRIHNIAFL